MPAPMPALLLIVSLAVLIWFRRNDVRSFRRFRAVDDSARRQRIFLRWARNTCLMYLGVPLIGLALLGRIEALWRVPADLFGPALLAAPGLNDDFLALLAGSVVAGGVLGAILALLVRRRRKPARTAVPGLDITPMVPRNRAELLRVIPLAVNAGISEEVFFRLYLPLLVVLCGAPPAFAFIAVTLIFGLLHRFQGWLGVLVTAVTGATFALLYLGTATLLAPIAFHLLINLNSLVLRPAVALRFPSPAD
ncbi:CPBP family intramembrane metalloprotease [Sphingomonas sp. HITSZ_GF]|uniref:CPBP family intramembrane glutamic endopeptidase n=1 Tax=Sphingomonas sp. HITSZ_GF TaxID=3037247 RepID=UPI00240CF594|nr:CPBP family intramembrane glutamic endopeptidase [Sphingomonas sp. HITSZ_GF]MDG2533290.1 CPBP family intramembrane metalloprotease [Sphingomonas sp. HITSZ_GF]